MDIIRGTCVQDYGSLHVCVCVDLFSCGCRETACFSSQNLAFCALPTAVSRMNGGAWTLPWRQPVHRECLLYWKAFSSGLPIGCRVGECHQVATRKQAVFSGNGPMVVWLAVCCDALHRCLENFEHLWTCNSLRWFCGQETGGFAKHGQLDWSQQSCSPDPFVAFSVSRALFECQTPFLDNFLEARIDPSMLAEAAPNGETTDYSWKQACSHDTCALLNVMMLHLKIRKQPCV